MAFIHDIIEKNIALHDDGLDVRLFVSSLDMRVHDVGALASVIFDLVVHPDRGIIDSDIVAAVVKAQLLLLGQLGGMVDQLDRYVLANPGSIPAVKTAS